MFKFVKFGLLCVYTATGFAMASGQSNIQGKMYGGQQPIVGAHAYLLSPAQSTTFGSASVSLITAGSPGTGTDATGVYVLTDQNGQFQINGQYTCTPNVPIYLYASMGNTGNGPNGAIANMAYIGVCGNVSPQTLMNEATTVALAYAVAGYATDPLHISYSGTSASLTGIQNAFANSSNLVNMATGTANPTIPSGDATVPLETVYTIANALASCINETSQGANTSNCSTLFSATSVNGVAPTSTAAAVMNIAHNPASSTSPEIQNGTNIASIINLSQAYQQFGPSLTSAPNDLTLGLTFTSSSIANATALAIDGSGNAWIASQQSSSVPTGSVVEIANPTAMLASLVTYPIVYTPQTTEPDSIAVDGGSQNIWIGTDTAVEEFSNTGAPASGSPFLATDLNFGSGFALNFDSTGNVWICGNSTVYELSAAGSVLSPTINVNGQSGYPLPSGTSAAPAALALDASNNVWVTDLTSNALVELNSQGSVLANLGPSGSIDIFDQPLGVAIDANKDVWVANNGNNDVVEYLPNELPSLVNYLADTTPSGSISTPVLTFTGIDGAGNSWSSLEGGACNSNNTACLGVVEVSATGKQLSGPGYIVIGNNSMGDATANATAIDGSGDVWILNKFAQSVTELVGAAAPVVTPLALAVSSNSLGARP